MSTEPVDLQAHLADLKQRVLEVLETFSIENLRQLIAEIEDQLPRDEGRHKAGGGTI